MGWRKKKSAVRGRHIHGVAGSTTIFATTKKGRQYSVVFATYRHHLLVSGMYVRQTFFPSECLFFSSTFRAKHAVQLLIWTIVMSECRLCSKSIHAMSITVRRQAQRKTCGRYDIVVTKAWSSQLRRRPPKMIVVGGTCITNAFFVSTGWYLASSGRRKKRGLHRSMSHDVLLLV